MIVPINLTYGERTVSFVMDIDENIPSDYAVMHYARQGQPCEPEVCHVMLRALKEGDTAVDGGANIGFFTLLMSKLVGYTGKVLAFEPGENNLVRLRANLALNACENVRVIEKPLWNHQGEVSFFAYDDGGANSLWAQKATDVFQMVPATTIDSEIGGEMVRLIKLDIEGAELKALQGARRVLRGHPIVIMELNELALERAGASVEAIRDLFLSSDCFTLSTTGHFPTHIPRDVEMVVARQNTNVMFARLEKLRHLWPQAHVWG